MISQTFTRIVASSVLILASAAAYEVADQGRDAPRVLYADTWAEIMEEATQRSQVMNALIQLSDVRGPRLLGTKNYYDAAVWSRNLPASIGTLNVRDYPRLLIGQLEQSASHPHIRANR